MGKKNASELGVIITTMMCEIFIVIKSFINVHLKITHQYYLIK